MPCLFVRDKQWIVTPEITAGCEWALLPIVGVKATIKWDGTACKIEGGKLFKRYDAKKYTQLPASFTPCQDAPDPISGHWPGWVPVTDRPEDRWHREALANEGCVKWADGTYELVGPRINKNPHGLKSHQFLKHGASVWRVPEPAFDGLLAHFKELRAEGLVWHHPNGAMTKLRRKDFGYSWPVDEEKDQ